MQLDQGHRTPREEGKGLGLTLFVFSVVSSQHWEHSCCPPNMYHLNFELLCGFSQIPRPTGTISWSLAGPPPQPGGPAGGLKPLSPSSPRNTCQLGWRRSPGCMNSSCKYLQGALRAPYKVNGPTWALWERCLACWEITILAGGRGGGGLAHLVLLCN